MRKLLLIITLFLSLLTFSQNENDDTNTFWKNVRFGGGLGLGFGNNTTTFAISPTAVYDFNEKFSLGAGVGYQYSKRDNVKSNVFSVSLLSLFNPINNIQLSIEFEQLFLNQSFEGVESQTNYPALYLGGAYRVSENVSLGVRYDVLYNSSGSIYASAISPIVRVFF